LFENPAIAALTQTVVVTIAKRSPNIDLAGILDNIEAMSDTEVIDVLAEKRKDKAR
jgi:hypothetical protein